MGYITWEIDIYADEKVVKYAHPKGLDWVKGQPPFDPDGVMNEPGFKVFHIPDLDFRSDGLTLKNELHELRAWSEKHPLIIILFLLPSNQRIIFLPIPGLTMPEKFTSAVFDELDKSLEDNLGREHLITPDMVRGKYATLESAVLNGNWPSLKAAKGKFLFIMDAHDSKRGIYVEGHPSLQGRLIFTDAEPGTPEAACMIRNNPQAAEIKSLVEKGYIIRTRADADTKEARLNDKTDFIAACNSGAQIITTDYYLKSTHFKSDYVVYFDGNKYVRLNPAFVK